MNEKQRCKWVNLNNPNYVTYHDHEWGIPHYDDAYLFTYLVLESFQAGLSWECILNKRDGFQDAFDDFDYVKIANYDEHKVEELMNDQRIVRNRRKICATITNAQVFMSIQKEFGTFSKYIWNYTNGQQIINQDDHFLTHSNLSDTISKDLKKRGMKFVGTTIIYSYLQAIGVINDHEKNCFCYKNNTK